MVKAVEIEIDGSHNEALLFRPLQRSVRGRFDMMRMGEPMARVKATDWPTPIPSQRLGIDADGNGFLCEPLHDDEYVVLKEKIESQGMRLEPAIQEFLDIDVATWQFWLKSAVDSGLAKIVRGKLPDKIDGKPRMNFITNDPEPPAVDKLTAAIEKQTAMFEKLLNKLGEK